MRRRRVLAGLALVLPGCGRLAWSAEVRPPTAVQAEVDALLAILEASGCRFQRNGSWHAAAVARAHLTRKWQEMQRRQWVGSTEGFIEQGASRSAITGQLYQVQCGNAPPQPSGAWMRGRLQSLRAGRV